MSRLVILLVAAISATAQTNLVVSTVAGNGKAGYNGEIGQQPGGPIGFAGITSITRDAQGNWVVADLYNQRVRVLTPDFSAARTLSGTGATVVPSFADGTPALTTAGVDTSFCEPQLIVPGPRGSVYLADVYGIFQIQADGTTRVVVGLGTRLTPGSGVGAFGAYTTSLAYSAPDDKLYFATPNITPSNSGRVRVLEGSNVRDITPNGQDGLKGDQLALTLVGGQLYVTDSATKTIYAVNLSSGERTPVLGPVASGWPTAVVGGPPGMGFIADSKTHLVYRLNFSGGVPPIVAGTGVAGAQGLNGPAALAQLNEPNALFYDLASNRLYIGEGAGSRLLYIDGLGNLKLAAGTGRFEYTGDTTPGPLVAADLRMLGPSGLAADPSGNLFWCDGNRLRVLSANGNTTNLVGNGRYAATPQGAVARHAPMGGCRGFALDGARQCVLFRH